MCTEITIFTPLHAAQLLERPLFSAGTLPWGWGTGPTAQHSHARNAGTVSSQKAAISGLFSAGTPASAPSTGWLGCLLACLHA